MNSNLKKIAMVMGAFAMVAVLSACCGKSEEKPAPVAACGMEKCGAEKCGCEKPCAGKCHGKAKHDGKRGEMKKEAAPVKATVAPVAAK